MYIYIYICIHIHMSLSNRHGGEREWVREREKQSGRRESLLCVFLSWTTSCLKCRNDPTNNNNNNNSSSSASSSRLSRANPPREPGEGETENSFIMRESGREVRDRENCFLVLDAVPSLFPSLPSIFFACVQTNTHTHTHTCPRTHTHRHTHTCTKKHRHMPAHVLHLTHTAHVCTRA